MARRGRFGRSPRSSPSITNTLVAIAREMQSQRDQNLMDAWQKGGMFEGQKATDELVLKHWHERLAGVAKDDPLYDTYKNTIGQYEYAIAESKASTAYAQGKKTDGEMAQFYLGWSKKVPQNSEFYRVLQRDAAQFMRAARAKAKATAAQAKEDAYRQAQSSDHSKYEAAGEYMTDVLRQLARSNALIGAGQDTDLTQFDTSDPAAMMNLLDQITLRSTRTPGPDSHGNDAVLYHDPVTGKGVTGADIVAQLTKLDPKFDGRVTLDYFRTLVNRQLKGQGLRLDRAQKTGHATDVNNLQKWQQYTSEIGRETNLWPVEQSYNNARSTFLSSWLSPTATPDTKLQAWKEYAASLTKLADGANVDDNTKARLLAEVNGDGSVKSMAEDFTGLNSSDNTTTTGGFRGDIAETHFDVERYIAQQEEVAKGQAAWTTGTTDKQGVFHPQPGGAEIGAATLQDIQAASPVAPAVIFVPQGNGAQTIPVVVSGVNISTVATDDKGQTVSVTDQNAVGSFYDVVVGGSRTRVYSYKSADGKTYYTTDTPWDDQNVHARQTPQGLQLDVSAYVPHQDANGAWVYPNGQPADMSGSGAFGLSDPNNSGQQHLVMNPSKATYLSDPARSAAGPDPASDFFSPTLAALMSTPEGMKTLASLKDNDQFKAQLQFEAYRAAGFTQDPATGAWAGGDQASFDKYNSQVILATHLTDVGDAVGNFLKGAYDLWSRTTTDPTFQASSQQTPTTLGSSERQRLARFGEGSGLPSDQVRGTQFGALGNVFEDGTNVFRRPGQDSADIMRLQLSGTIKVPEPPKQLAPTPTPVTPAPAVTSVTTTVPAPSTPPPPPSSGGKSPYRV